MTSQDLISSIVLKLLGPYLEARGGKLDDALAEAGMTGSRFDDPFAMIPFASLARALNAAARMTGDDNFGLNYGEFLAPRGAGVMGQLQLTAPTIRHLVASTAEFAPVGIPALTLSFTETADHGTLSGHLPSSLDVDPRQIADCLLAILITRIRRGTGARWTPLATDLEYREPADTRTLRRMFGEHLLFEQSAYRVMIGKATLDQEIAGIPHGPFDMTRTYMQRLRQKAPFMATPVASETARIILQRLSGELAISLEAVAASLGRSSRSLQTLLDQEGTTFESVLLDTRLQLARRHLRDSDQSMTEIASRLGFASPSVFSRWSVAQLKATPTEVRRQLRKQRLAGGSSSD